MMEKVFKRVPREEIYARTGIQCLPFNTLFQLAAHVEAGLPPRATRLLLIPDLFHFLLTGRAVTEYTNATTTQMLRCGTAHWDIELMDRLGLPTNLLRDSVGGRACRTVEAAVAMNSNWKEWMWCASDSRHGSAVVGAPFETGGAFISSVHGRLRRGT
jgi:rhamnulokinase